MKKLRKSRMGRRRYALTLLGCLLVLEVLAAVLNMKNQTMLQAKRDLEIQRGWPSSQVIWQELLDSSFWNRKRIQLHVLDDACVLVEMTWDWLEGWSAGPISSAETREGWPVQARAAVVNDDYKVYVIGYPTDPHIDLERVTFGLFHWEDDRGFVVDPEDQITIAPEDLIYHEGRTYFVCEFDLSQRLTEEEMQNFGRMFGGVLIHVTDENGQPILWEDGWGDDYGEWMNLG